MSQRKLIKQLLFALTVIMWMVALAWFVQDKTFEPLLAFLGGTAALMGAWLLPDGEDVRPPIDSGKDIHIIQHRRDTITIGNHNITGNYNTIFKLYQSAPGKPQLDRAAFDEVLERYLTWVVNKYGVLHLRGLQRGGEKARIRKLDQVYVSLQADLASAPDAHHSRSENRTRQIDMADLLPQTPRLEIVGGAGSGKTTYLRFIAALLAEALLDGNSEQVTAKLGLSGSLPLPIFVTLSEYNIYRRKCQKQGQNTSDAAAGTLTAYLSKGLIHKEVRGLTPDFFTRLLQNGQGVLLLLDGADEVANERERELVIEQIENLSHNQGMGRMVVTSRPRALRGNASLPHFRTATVQPMTEKQVQALVETWCASAYPLPEVAHEIAELGRQIRELETFRKKQNLPRLIDSPMLVTIVAIVYHDQTKLPDQRAELYEHCIMILLEDMYKSRAVKDDLRQTMADWKWLAQIAWRMMCAGKEAGRTLTERNLKAWLVALWSPRFGAEVAHTKSVQAVAFLRQRESVIEERDKVYQFIHLTFQEFLAAFYLVREIHDAEKIYAAFAAQDAFAQSWWRETILLTFGYAHMQSAGNAEKLVRVLALREECDATALASAELAGAGLLEMGSENAKLKREVADRLVDLLGDKALIAPPTVRLLAGDALGQLGDPRPGVGVRPDGLPDIAWGKAVCSGEYQIGGKYGFKAGTTAPIKQPYRLAEYQITNAQFECFLQAQDVDNERWWKGMSHDKKYKARVLASSWTGANRPRESVSWYQAVAFCRWLDHHLKVAGLIEQNELIRLPHEYEWEVAARYVGEGRSDQRTYPWGETITPNYANYDNANLRQTLAVGVFPQGQQPQTKLYDLSGNLWEWCLNKSSNPEIDEVDRSRDGRTLRGGSWVYNFNLCRASYRLSSPPDYCSSNVGFRVVVVLSSHPGR